MNSRSNNPSLIRFGDLIETISPRGLQIGASNYDQIGSYPIIDQGQSFIVGYTDLEDALIRDVPLVVFGDHTRIVKFIDFPFAVGADGTKLLRSNRAIIPYLFYLTEYAASTIDNLGYARHFKELKAAIVPFFADQERQYLIAAILGTWDAAIAKAERLLAAKMARRRQWHASLVLRSSSPKRPLGEIVTAVRREIPRPNKPYTAMGIRSHGKGTFHRYVKHPDEVDMDTLFVVAERDLIVNITFAWEGAIALAGSRDAGCLVSHRFPTFEVKEDVVNRDYLGYAVNNRRFFYELSCISPGSAGRNRVLNQKDFLDLAISIPPRKQQDRIARLLNSADADIAATISIVERLKRQRLGLMQKLLTGEYLIAEAATAELSPAAD